MDYDKVLVLDEGKVVEYLLPSLPCRFLAECVLDLIPR